MTTRIPSSLFGPAKDVSERVHQQDADGPRQYIRRISAWNGQDVSVLEAIVDEMSEDHFYVRNERAKHGGDAFHERYEVIDAANALLDRKDTPLYHRAAVYMMLAYMSHHDPYFQIECLQSTHVYLDQLELRTRRFQEYLDNLDQSIVAGYAQTRRELGIQILLPEGVEPQPIVKPDLRLDHRPAGVRRDALKLFAVLSKAISDVEYISEDSRIDEEAVQDDSEKDIGQEKDAAEKMDAGPDRGDITMADVPAIVVQTDDGSSSASPFSGTAAIAGASSSGPQELSSAFASASSTPSDSQRDARIQKGPRSPVPSLLRPHGASASAKLDTATGIGHGDVRLSGVSPPSDDAQAGSQKATSVAVEDKNATQSLFNLLGSDSGYPTHGLGHEPVHSRYRKSNSTKSKPSTTKSRKKQSQRPGGIDTLRHAFDPPEATAPPPVSPKFAAETPYDVPVRMKSDDSKDGGKGDKEDEQMRG
ncbi:hypothetical protein M409DRAFT_61463 [Zasmidium cellare ATCC 36951]|uniref:Uncharacterized protein n=1 Tax=Zasmidium cellare ATCC 36951 TaxID=1080233 RepID=A0A6A6BYN3_ZASCE|nr:uncharacterized protein M409DRAFT_61463 [Zasmidium cellare ATCC 36951]KAF2158682.1 hypothetical protein M409DRAFT_61463 [Zasmidium cellare ATCC 36951]